MTSNEPRRPDRVRILLVDDQPGNLLSLKAVLEREDYDLVLAHGGEEALAHVLRNDFAVILLDVAMPGMDGFEVASIIKQREAYRVIPIVFVTGSVHPHVDWIFKAYDVGAVDFLEKPLDPRQVRAKVAVFVELFRQKRQIAEQAERLRAQERRAQALELERTRLQHERTFRNLAESIPHVVWMAGKDGGIEYISRRWSEATGRPERAAKGTGWLDAIHPDDAERVRRQWDESIRAGEAFEFEFRLRSANGTLHWYTGRALPERQNGGGVVRWLGTWTDADEPMRAQEDLRQAVRLREEFLSVASHELRTPLTALMLRVQSMRRAVQGQPEAERFARNLDQVIRQGERMKELIGRLLDVSRLAAGRIELKLEQVDLVELAREVMGSMVDQAARAGCTVELHVKQEQALGTWDRLRVGQVLTNLLSNALKYGAGKPVDLALSVDERRVRIAVADRGIGMSPEAVERIFGRFERAVSQTHYGGLGLGLYVVAQVVEAHGGRVNVETQPGHGSTFVVELPRSPSKAQPVAAQEGKHAGF